MVRIHLRSIIACALLMGALAALPAQWAAAQTGPDAPIQISWEVRNRFRLFREERDFLLHTDSARGRSILASEQALPRHSGARGWARCRLILFWIVPAEPGVE